MKQAGLPPYRRVEFHDRAGRGSGETRDRAARHQPDRVAPVSRPGKVRAACAKHGLSITAYSPIARGKAAGDKELKLIGLHHRKTAAQVCLRYLLQEGAIVIPRTVQGRAAVGKSRGDDFELDDAEMDEIRKLAKSGWPHGHHGSARIGIER